MLKISLFDAVIEIPSDASILDAVQILSRNNILAAPVRNADAESGADWKDRYIGIIDYSVVILWVLENAELAAFALSAGSATGAALGTGAVGCLGAIAIGATGPAAIAGLTLAASGAALAGGIAAEKSVGRDATIAADHVGEQFYRLLLQEEPFKSTTVNTLIPTVISLFLYTINLIEVAHLMHCWHFPLHFWFHFVAAIDMVNIIGQTATELDGALTPNDDLLVDVSVCTD